MAIRFNGKHETRNHQIIAELRELAGAGAPSDPAIQIKRKVAEIATLAALLHGGDWRVQIDHEVGLFVVARRNRRRSRI